MHAGLHRRYRFAVNFVFGDGAAKDEEAHPSIVATVQNFTDHQAFADPHGFLALAAAIKNAFGPADNIRCYKVLRWNPLIHRRDPSIALPSFY
ncbi:hypothetical protein ASD39_07410 [Sphingomonas sp. Root50]|nr:hypothetical protein ASD17_05715 [Sphingomonas sp. Root1294]KQY67745.1 hypothetical protein ASD39_07410 [Sphingomonas sp. Root50]